MNEWKNWIKEHQTNLLIMLVLVQLLIGIVGQFLRNKPEVATFPLDEWATSEEISLPSVEEEIVEAEEVEWMVDIKGEVIRPGVYQIEPDMRVNDVILLAGGLKEEANTTHINFAQQLEDQMMIYVPHKDEEVLAAIQSPTSAEKSRLINLNTADVTELQQLNGIGEKKALQIVQHRTVHGKFASIEELMEVSGIGQKTFDSLKDHITISN